MKRKNSCLKCGLSMRQIGYRGSAFSLSEPGFSLLELMIAIVILGILAGTAASYYVGLKEDAVASKVKADLNELGKVMVAFMSDEYNITGERPAKMTELTEKTFKLKVIKDETGSIAAKYPMSADINAIKEQEFADKPNYTTSEVEIKRSFVEKIPPCPWGDAYYADLYNICAMKPGNKQPMKLSYTNQSVDRFAVATPSASFYNILQLGVSQLNANVGMLSMASFDSKNNSPANAIALTSLKPISTTSSQQDKFATFEFCFKYRQETSAEAVQNSIGNRILETNSGSSYVPCGNGMVFLFKEAPAVGAEAAVMPKSGIGIKFSASDWEAYESPSGGAPQKIAGGGWEAAASHSVKFVFKTAYSIQCYIDGDLKATLAYSTAASPVASVYFAISPDMFTSLNTPPAPYPPIPILADCFMDISQISINNVDFSNYYDFKIPSK